MLVVENKVGALKVDGTCFAEGIIVQIIIWIQPASYTKVLYNPL